ncbi:MAG: ROK family protein [Candidatus Saganbacteria bacterium]|nr:ROK family protein [Candidatus Saganbacteria bacterium]
MKNYIIGIDLGGTKISAAIADAKGKIIEQITVPTEAVRGKKHVIDRIVFLVRALYRGTGIDPKDVLCIGIGAPGPVITEKGIIMDPPNLPGWIRVPLRSILEKKLKKKVILENDANCAALAELKFGAGKDFDSFMYVTVSTGIGGGIVIGKKLFRGSSDSAGEIGHTVIDINGPKCPCGKYGHLEGLAAGPAISKRAGMKPEVLREKAMNGDKKAIEEIKYTGYLIGIGFSNAVNLLNPEAIIVGGGISNFGKLLFDPIRKTVKENALARVKIIPARLKNNVGVMGAVALCL